MARRVQLAQLLSDLRAEIGASVAVSASVDFEDNLKSQLRRTQETLYDDHDWRFMRRIFSKDLAAGQRFYDLPTDLNPERIEKVTVLYGGVYEPVCRGIGFEEYSVYDSINNERVGPVRNYDIRDTGVKEQIEVWPLPPGNDQTLYFEGIKALNPLVSDSDRAELDDKLIYLFAAAELLARQKSADAPAKLAAAQQRYDTLKARWAADRPDVRLGLGKRDTRRAGRVVVRVTS